MPKIDTTVGKLVEMIHDGELRLPEMQRRYVWPATRVRDLLDSLYRGYPSGTILVWETDREMPVRDLAVSQQDSPFKGHKMLLDGQQRLTSLSAIIRGEPIKVRGKKKPIEIMFNLDHPDAPPEVIEVEGDAAEGDENETDGDEDGSPNLLPRLKLRTFVVGSHSLQNDPRWVKVSEVFRELRTDSQILKPLVSSLDDPLFDKFSKRLQALRKIQDYQYVMHVLDKNLSYEEVAEIFVRVNSLGIKLRGSDLALAQITSRWQGSLKLFEDFQDECEDKWFTLDLGLLVRSLVVFTTEQCRFKSVGNISMQRLKDGWEAAKEGMRFSVNFLRANAGIEDESLLVSAMLLIVPAFYAWKRGFKLTAEDERGLKQWVFYANARGHYSGASESTLDTDLNLISKGGSTVELIAVLKQQIGRLEVSPEDFAGRDKRSALFATTYLALKARGAKDWRTGLALSLTHQGRDHFIEHHHIFPKASLKQAGYDTAEINEIANMGFVAGGTNRKLAVTSPEEYLAEIVQQRGEEALEAHCIPLDRNLWKREAFPQFLEYRRNALAKVVNSFIENIEAKPRLDTSLPDIDSLIAAGENDGVEFKSSARWDYREQKLNKVLELVIAKTLAGFLNCQGGLLLLGVSDNGTVLGLQEDYKTLTKRPDKDGYQQFMVNLISGLLGKVACSLVKMDFVARDGMEVCVLTCAPSPRPIYVKDAQNDKFFLRTGNATQELGTKDSVDYIKSRWV